MCANLKFFIYSTCLILLQILRGNSDTATVQSHQLKPSFFASHFRLLPYSIHRRTVCLRLELLGCLYKGNDLIKLSIIVLSVRLLNISSGPLLKQTIFFRRMPNKCNFYNQNWRCLAVAIALIPLRFTNKNYVFFYFNSPVVSERKICVKPIG